MRLYYWIFLVGGLTRLTHAEASSDLLATFTSIANHPATVDLPRFRELVANSATDVNQRNPQGQTPLHVVAASDCTECVALLFARADLDPEVYDVYGYTPLAWATILLNTPLRGAMEQALARRRLLPAQRALNAQFLQSVERHDLAAARADLAKGADVNARFPDGDTALHRAAWYGWTDLAALLLEQKRLHINAPDGARQNTALHLAIYEGQIEIIKMLARDPYLGVNVHGSEHLSAPELAEQLGQTEIAQILREIPAPASGV
jgi:ankyrin repeat protein